MRFKLLDIRSLSYQEFVFTAKNLYFWDDTTYIVNRFHPSERIKLSLEGAVFDYDEGESSDGKMYRWFEWKWYNKPYYANSTSPRALPKFNIQYWPNSEHYSVFYAQSGPYANKSIRIGQLRSGYVDVWLDDFRAFDKFMMENVKTFYESLPEFKI